MTEEQEQEGINPAADIADLVESEMFPTRY